METTTVSIMCGVDGCSLYVTFEFEEGESATYWEPGYPDWWYLYSHQNNADNPDKYNAHCDKLSDDLETQARCGIVASQSWDNVEEYYSY